MPIARCVVVDHLPGGRAVAAIECDGEMVFLIAADRPPAEIAAQLTDVMQAEISAGTWSQYWGDPVEPPRLRRVG